MAWLIFGLYFIGVLITLWRVNKSNDDLLSGDDVFDCVFRGFLSVTWGVWVIPFLLGRIGGRRKNE